MAHMRLERVRGELKVEVALEPAVATMPTSPQADVPIYLPEPPMTDPIATLKQQLLDVKADIMSEAAAKATATKATATRDLGKAKTEITTHWASARVWVAVIAVALAIYLGRHDVGTIITQILPGAKDIVVAFLYSAAIVESANLLANAYKASHQDPMVGP